MSVTPENERTVSMTSQGIPAGPTPKNEFKKPMNQRHYFMSPTDAMVSPCTQKLQSSRRMPRKPIVGTGNQRPKMMYVQGHHPTSKLANKENEQKAPVKSVPPSESTQRAPTKPMETNV